MEEKNAQQNQGCGGCGGNNAKVTDFSSLINPKEKLGKCPSCIIISIAGTFLGWIYFMIYNTTTSGYAHYSKYIFYVACFFSIFLAAHIIAFVIRMIFKGRK